MVYIEKHWETVDSLQDISRIIREYYNTELADIMDELIEIQEYEKCKQNEVDWFQVYSSFLDRIGRGEDDE